MGLEGADRAGGIVEPLLEVGNYLPGAVFIKGAGLRGLLRLLPDRIEGKAVLGGVPLVPSSLSPERSVPWRWLD